MFGTTDDAVARQLAAVQEAAKGVTAQKVAVQQMIVRLAMLVSACQPEDTVGTVFNGPVANKSRPAASSCPAAMKSHPGTKKGGTAGKKGHTVNKRRRR